MNSRQSVANVSGVSTAIGFSFCHLNGNKSPKELSQASSQNTRRNSRENFCKKLFSERPRARKLSYKMKQSADFDDNDRHFSLDESRLQGSKSKKLSDILEGQQNNDTKKLRNTSLQGIENINYNNNLSQKNLQLNKKTSLISQQTAGQMSLTTKATNNTTTHKQQSSSSKIKQPNSSPLAENDQDSTEQMEQIEEMEQLGDILQQVSSTRHHNHNPSEGFNKNHNNNNNKQKNNHNKSKQGHAKDWHAIEMGDNKNIDVIESVVEWDKNKSKKNMIMSGQQDQSQQMIDQNQTQVSQEKEENVERGVMVSSIFWCVCGSILISLLTYSYGNVYMFTFCNSAIFGLSFAFLLVYMIVSHPFFKLTNELCIDIFTTPKFAYLSFVTCVSLVHGFIFGMSKVVLNLNLFSILPILSILSFFLFSVCIVCRQPILYKRLKLTYGNTIERKLTLSQSKHIKRGMTQQKLPDNLNNFLPDEQGPSIKSIEFYFAMVLVILFQIAFIYYTMNQRHIWNHLIEDNFNYIYAVILGHLILGEIIAGVIYKIDSKFKLEFKYELEYIRTIFTVSLYHLFYLMLPSVKVGFSIVLIKLIFKFLIYYFYPTNYVFIKTFFRRTICRCFKEKQVEFKDMQRRLFTKKFGILQFNDLMCLLIFYIVLILFYTQATLENDYTQLTSNEFKNITGLCIAEFIAEIILTYIITGLLSKNSRFKGLTIKSFLKEINLFLVDGWYLTLFTYLSVFAAISIVLTNDYLKYYEFKHSFADQL